MARLMRYMLNMKGNKIFSTLYIKLSKPVIYSLVPPILERVDVGRISECGINVTNTFPEGVKYLYTDDGTYPTKDSPELPDRITKNCTIQVIAVVEQRDAVLISASTGSLVIDDLRNEMPAFRLCDGS